MGGVLLGAVAMGAASSASPAQAQVTVTVAPPALRAEVRTTQPSPRHAWVCGYWQFAGGRYVWSPGRWEMPAQAGATWQGARWSQVGGRWVLTPGRWAVSGGVTIGVRPPNVVVQNQVVQQPGVVTVGIARPPTPAVTVVVQQPPVVAQQPAAIEVTIAPPAMRVERRGPPPSPTHVWITGFWQWNGTAYAWAPGRWEAPQQPGAMWIAPRWQRRGHGWFLLEGRWDHGRGGDDNHDRGDGRDRGGNGDHGDGHGRGHGGEPGGNRNH